MTATNGQTGTGESTGTAQTAPPPFHVPDGSTCVADCDDAPLGWSTPAVGAANLPAQAQGGEGDMIGCWQVARTTDPHGDSATSGEEEIMQLYVSADGAGGNENLWFRVRDGAFTSWTSLTGLRPATDAEIKAGSDVDAYVPPDLLSRLPGVAVAWGDIARNGTLGASRKVGSTSWNNAEGWYHVNLDVTMADSGYTVLATSVGGHVPSESKAWRVRDKRANGFNLSNSSNSQGVVNLPSSVSWPKVHYHDSRHMFLQNKLAYVDTLGLACLTVPGQTRDLGSSLDARPAASKQSPARSIVQILLGPAGRFAEPCLEEPDDSIIGLRREGLCCDLAGEDPAGEVPGADVDRHRPVPAKAEQAYPIGGCRPDRGQLDQLRFRLPIVQTLEPAGQGLRMPLEMARESNQVGGAIVEPAIYRQCPLIGIGQSFDCWELVPWRTIDHSDERAIFAAHQIDRLDDSRVRIAGRDAESEGDLERILLQHAQAPKGRTRRVEVWIAPGHRPVPGGQIEVQPEVVRQ